MESQITFNTIVMTVVGILVYIQIASLENKVERLRKDLDELTRAVRR